MIPALRTLPSARLAPWMLLPPAALVVGLAVVDQPWLAAAGVVASCVFVWSATGERAAGWILLAYLGALAVVPTYVVQLESGRFPVALSDLLVLPLGMALLASPRRREGVPVPLQRVGLALLALILALATSIVLLPLGGLATNLSESVLRLLRFAPALMVFAGLVRLVPGGLDLDRLIGAVVLAAGAQACLGIAQFLLQKPLTFPSGRSAEQYLYLRNETLVRAYGTIGESSSLAHLVGIGTMAALYLLGRRRGVRLLGPAAVVLLCSLCLLFTYSRGMVLSLAVGVAVYVCLTRTGPTSRVALTLAGAFAILLLLQTAGADYLGQLGERFAFRGFGTSSEALDAYLSGRLGLWRQLADFLRGNPAFLPFGVGYRALQGLETATARVGDNNYLTMLIECGLFGLGSMLAVLWTSVSCGWRVLRDAAAPLRPAGALVVALWAMHASFMLVGDAMTYWRSMPILFAITAAVGAAGLSGTSRA